jgi:hypothetical protein
MYGVIDYGSNITIKLVRIKGIKTESNKFDQNTYNSADMTLEYLGEGTKYYGTWSTTQQNLVTI